MSDTPGPRRSQSSLTWSTKPWTKLELVLTAVWMSVTNFTQSWQTSSSAYKNDSKLLRKHHISQGATAQERQAQAPGSQAFNLLPFTGVKVLKGQAVGHGLKGEPVFCPAP